MTFHGKSATPCVLRLNGEETTPSALVYAGDSIEFTPAVPGASAQKTPEDLLGRDHVGGVLINGRPAALDTPLRSGDQVISSAAAVPPAEEPEEQEEAPQTVSAPEPVRRPEAVVLPQGPAGRPVCVYLNGQPLVLPGKAEGGPYYLMDLLDQSGIDFDKLDGPLVLQVNGEDCPFTQELRSNDQVTIRRS